MPIRLRIATFNLENLDDKPGKKPTLDERIELMRPQLLRLNADVLCLQEVNGQEQAGQPRRLLALDKLLEGTDYAGYFRVSTLTKDGEQVYDQRNLVILSRHEIVEFHQYKHDYASCPRYREVTAAPAENAAGDVRWERPILHAKLNMGEGRTLHVINLHLKSRIPTPIEGQALSKYRWKSASGWAEGFFISSIKRVGQALETRILIDSLFDAEEDALIAVGGDFNAELHEVPVEAIRGEVENTGNPILAKRAMVPCEQSFPQSSRFSLLHRGKRRMLDHLLVSRMLMQHYRTVEIHNESLHDESIRTTDDKLFPESDHAPVVAEFAFPER